jgi:DNA polymerase-3 subunit delta'
MRLGDILGQDRAVAVLQRALAADRLAHAYLFDGPEGVGKRSTAIALGLALLCPRAPREGCGHCEICNRILASNHPDVLVFDCAQLGDLAKASSEKSAVKYAARNVFPYALAAPHEAAARLLVLENADELSPDVQNTLLKTLEEPRANVHLVLVTPARERLLPTILSRTQRVRFTPVPPAALRLISQRQGLPEARAATAAALAGGSVSRLIALVTAEGDVGPFAEAAALRAAAGVGEANAVFDAAVNYGDKESKQALPAILSVLANLYRDAVATTAGAPELVQLGERRAEIEALAQSGSLPELLRGLRAVLDADQAVIANVNAVSLLERLLFDLGRAHRGGSPAGRAA